MQKKKGRSKVCKRLKSIVKIISTGNKTQHYFKKLIFYFEKNKPFNKKEKTNLILNVILHPKEKIILTKMTSNINLK